jgi:hypothetical protein
VHISGWPFKYYSIPAPPIGGAGIVAEPTEDLHRLQDELIKAFEPYTVKTGTPAAFFSEDGGRVGLSARRLWHGAQETQGADADPLSAALMKDDRSSQKGGLRRPRSELHLEPRSSLRAIGRPKTPVLPDELWGEAIQGDIERPTTPGSPRRFAPRDDDSITIRADT